MPFAVFRDLAGQRFGSLVVKERAPDRGGRVAWFCVCDCGRTQIKRTQVFTRTKWPALSCGRCIGSAEFRAEYNAWFGMRDRCHNPKNISFLSYGGRGVVVCERWRDDFHAFLQDIGRRPRKTDSVDRINNDGHYEPGNVRWATRREQSNNRRTNRFFTVNGRTQTLAEWARERGSNYCTVQYRIRAGWPVVEALSLNGCETKPV